MGVLRVVQQAAVKFQRRQDIHHYNVGKFILRIYELVKSNFQLCGLEYGKTVTTYER